MRDVEALIGAARAVQGAFALSKPDFVVAAVGAALRTASGAIYTGISVDVACGIGFCAEHAAVAEMLKHRETEIAAIVAVNKHGILPPCGRCRELILQLTPKNGNTQVVLPGGRTAALEALLPEYWLHQKSPGHSPE
jgi:cytidine deaminase